MRERMPALPTDAVKWAAVVGCDASYDGSFYYGVTTTKVFCRPSCPAKKPLRKHVRFFLSPQEALAAGFRPCMKCRPDRLRHEPGRELAEKAKLIFAQSFDSPQTLRCLTAELPVSSTHLMRLFKKYAGCTQRQYLLLLRIAEARRLLEKTDLPVIQVALQSGFKSLANFYKKFRENTNMSPAEYRRAQREKP